MKFTHFLNHVFLIHISFSIRLYDQYVVIMLFAHTTPRFGDDLSETVTLPVQPRSLILLFNHVYTICMRFSC